MLLDDVVIPFPPLLSSSSLIIIMSFCELAVGIVISSSLSSSSITYDLLETLLEGSLLFDAVDWIVD
jgi:hypothetical protein